MQPTTFLKCSLYFLSFSAANSKIVHLYIHDLHEHEIALSSDMNSWPCYEWRAVLYFFCPLQCSAVVRVLCLRDGCNFCVGSVEFFAPFFFVLCYIDALFLKGDFLQFVCSFHLLKTRMSLVYTFSQRVFDLWMAVPKLACVRKTFK